MEFVTTVLKSKILKQETDTIADFWYEANLMNKVNKQPLYAYIEPQYVNYLCYNLKTIEKSIWYT